MGRFAIFRFFLIEILLLVLFSACLINQARATQGPDKSLLQFVSGGHVLGFHRAGMYLTGGDHTLKIEFLGAESRAPQGAGPQNTGPGRPAPMTMVTYPELWPGVTLVYESRPGTLVKSTYLVNPGRPRSRIPNPAPVQPPGAGGFERSSGDRFRDRPDDGIQAHGLAGYRRPADHDRGGLAVDRRP